MKPLFEILGALTLGFGIIDEIDTNKKARNQKFESIPTIMKRQEIFEKTAEIKTKDYAPHLKKATPEWKKGRII